MIDVRDVLFRKGDQPSPTLGRQLEDFSSAGIGLSVYGIVTRKYEGAGRFGKHDTNSGICLVVCILQSPSKQIGIVSHCIITRKTNKQAERERGRTGRENAPAPYKKSAYTFRASKSRPIQPLIQIANAQRTQVMCGLGIINVNNEGKVTLFASLLVSDFAFDVISPLPVAVVVKLRPLHVSGPIGSVCLAFRCGNTAQL